jgi:replicative DNA helicase
MESDEQSFLSCAYDRPEVIDLGVSRGLTPAHFTDHHYGQQWKLLVEQRTTGGGVDTGSVYALAHGSGRLDSVGGIVKITQASAGEVGTGVSAPAFLSVLVTRHAQREAWKLLQRARELVEQNGVDLTQVSSLAEEVVSVCGLKGATKARSLDDIDADIEKKVEQAKSGVRDESKLVKWGLPKCDRFLTPIEPHEYALICARPSVGKSSMLTHLTGVNLQRGLKIAYFSLETSDTAVFSQIAAQIAGLNLQIMREWMPEHHRRFAEVRAKIKASKRLQIYDRDMTMDAITSRCRLLAASFSPNAVMIDYLGLIQTPGKSQYERTTIASNGMIPLRKHLGCALIVANQLNRDGQKPDKETGIVHEPSATNLRDSGHLEQDAHRIDIIHWKDGASLDVPVRDYKILQPKLRDGPTGSVDGIKFRASTTQFSEG